MSYADDFIAGLRVASERAIAERQAQVEQALRAAARSAREERRVVEAGVRVMGCKVLLVPDD